MMGGTALRGARAMGGPAIAGEALRLAAMRRDHVEAQVRTRWMLVASVVMHGGLLALLPLIHDQAPSAPPITEIMVLTPEDLRPAPLASPPTAPELPGAARRSPPPTSITAAQAPATAPAIPAPPRGDRGRARAREVASAVGSGDMLAGIDAMVGDLGKRSATARGGSPDRTSAQSEERAAAARSAALAGAAAGEEAGRDALERTGQGAAGGRPASPLARDAVVVGDLAQVTSGGGDGDAAGGAGERSHGTRTTESLMAVVHRYAGGIKYCYDQILSARPGTQGRLVLLITISASGAVTRAQILANTIKDSELEACVQSQVKSWKFPRCDSPDPVSFRCPLIFTPPEG